MKSAVNDNSILLHKHGLKVTPLRLAIIEVLGKHHSPLTAEEISSKLTDVEFDRATLFRSLKTFSETELIRGVDLGEGFMRYEIVCKKHDHHHHVMCTSCKKIETIPFCVPPQISNHLLKVGYTNLSHRMDFFGLCNKCS
jgi:Fur family ferric uptake transcriptional regulator